MESNWIALMAMLLALETTLLGGIWGFAWFLSKRFTQIYSKIQATLDLMVEKLEYHEQHDDKRFSQVTDSLWALRVEQAKTNKDKDN